MDNFAIKLERLVNNEMAIVKLISNEKLNNLEDYFYLYVIDDERNKKYVKRKRDINLTNNLLRLYTIVIL